MQCFAEVGSAEMHVKTNAKHENHQNIDILNTNTEYNYKYKYKY